MGRHRAWQHTALHPGPVGVSPIVCGERLQQTRELGWKEAAVAVHKDQDVTPCRLHPGLAGRAVTAPRLHHQWRPDVPEPRTSHVLEDKVRSEVLGRAELRDVDIVLNDVDGTIEVRGEVADEQVRSVLVGAIRAVDGVRDVHDLTHRPGQPAPNKAVAGAPTTTSG